MESLSLKYRPKTFEDVVEQGIITEILNKSIRTNTYKHAYLFAGPSGCGKTTMARLFARYLNNGNCDIEELDAASNNGVDQVRAIIARANSGSITGMLVIVIDECHMLTTAAWNALLKPIEEPVEGVTFILCTTEPHKIPDTIKNRVQRYNFTRISTKGIYDRLVKICQNEGFTNYEATCDLISKRAHGGMRDAITLLDQCADLSTNLDIEITKALLGDFSYESMIRFTNFIIEQDQQSTLAFLSNLYNEGYDLKNFIDTYLEFLIDLVKYILFRDIRVTSLPMYLETIQDQKSNLRYITSFPEASTFFNWLASRIKTLKTDLKNDPIYKTTIEIEFLKLCLRK